MDRLTCPKCGSPWRSFERSGITIDQCTGCRGVFLAPGELEHLVSSEQQWYVPAAQAQAPVAPAATAHHGGQGGYRPDHYQGYRTHKRKSFLSELLDFD